MRSNEKHEYFEEVRFKIKKYDKAHLKVAVKMPPVKNNYSIDGFLEIKLGSFPSTFLPISAQCYVPEI